MSDCRALRRLIRGPFRGASRGFISVTETAAIHLITSVCVCFPGQKYKEEMPPLALFPIAQKCGLFPEKFSLNILDKTISNHCGRQIRWTRSCGGGFKSPRVLNEEALFQSDARDAGRDVTNSVRVNMV